MGLRMMEFLNGIADTK